MLLITFYLLPILLAAVIFLDVRRKINLTYKGFMAFFLIALPHISIIIYLVDNRLLKKLDYGHIENTLTIGIFILFTYIFLKVNLFPRINEEIDEFRVKILIGGRRLVLYSLYSGFTQIIFYLFLFEMLKDIPKGIIIIDTIIAAVSLIVFYINGMARILITSKRLNIIKKIIAVFTMLIPVVNIPVMVYACGAAKEEIEHECYRLLSKIFE